MKRNAAVDEAYESGKYTDKQGNLWVRGMDGWFLDMGESGRMLYYHHDFQAMVIEETEEKDNEK